MHFFDSNKVIPDLIEHLVSCLELDCVYLLGNSNFIDELCKTIKIQIIDIISEADKNGLIYIAEKEKIEWNYIKRCVKNNQIFLLNIDDKNDVPTGVDGIFYDLKNIEGANAIFLAGKLFNYHICDGVDDFKVLAIMHFYNEEDILEKTVRYLLSQKIDVYLLDNYSSDNSYEIAQRLKKEFPSRIFLEQFKTEIIDSEGKKQHAFSLYEQLERSEQISKELDYNWFTHYDVDEIRLSPWSNVCLRDAIFYIDSLGFNCIESTLIDFRLTNYDEMLFNTNGYFLIRYNVQSTMRKTWKKNMSIDLKSSGGHVATFYYPKTYPLRLVIKHYPFRNIDQASRKVFLERKVDFAKEKKERNWHGHYDSYITNKDFICNKDNLLFWDEDTFEKYYLPIVSCSGIKDDNLHNKYILPDIKNKKLIIYGAGNGGKYAVINMAKENNIVGWVDKSYNYKPRMYGIKIISPEIIKKIDYDYIVIAVKNVELQNEIIEKMEQNGIDRKRILCII